MIQSVMNSGFKALSAWLLFFSAVVLLFFIAASVVNAISGSSMRCLITFWCER